MGSTPTRRASGVRMVMDDGHKYGSQWEAICSVAEKLGPKAETVRLWIRQAERDSAAGRVRRPRSSSTRRHPAGRVKPPARIPVFRREYRRPQGLGGLETKGGLMADRSAIEWTGATWNPTTGCDRTSPGCDNCYAMALSRRLKAMGSAKYQNDGDAATSGPGFGVTMHEDALTVPLRWRAPRTVFVDSMSDLFHSGVTDEFIARVFSIMAATPQHTYQVLTKRSRRLAQLAPALSWPANVWIGTSIETDRYSYRADHLRAVEAAAVRFLSLEPLIGPLPSLNLTRLDWVIVGGESGRGHRPFDVDWVRDLRDRCVARGVPFFFKQYGGRTPKAGGRVLDGRTWDEMPDSRRIRLSVATS